MKVMLNMYDSSLENVEVGVGDFVVANTDEFGLKEGHKYKVLEVDSCDMLR